MTRATINGWEVECSHHGWPYWGQLRQRDDPDAKPVRCTDAELFDLYRALKAVLTDMNAVRSKTGEQTFDL